MARILIYDCEIQKVIPSAKYNPQNSNYHFCEGWKDFENMGIAVIGAWTNYAILEGKGKSYLINENDLEEGSYHVFFDYALPVFAELAFYADIIVGFNSLSFDDELLRKTKKHSYTLRKVKTNYDLLRRIWLAAGLPEVYTQGVTQPGYSLNNLAITNLAKQKNGHGAEAGVLYQEQKFEPLAKYCLNDVYLTKKLLFKFLTAGLIDPNNPYRIVQEKKEYNFLLNI